LRSVKSQVWRLRSAATLAFARDPDQNVITLVD
jgi:hypothetical protein